MNQESIEIAIESVAGQQLHDGQPFPLVLTCESADSLDAVTRWVAEQASGLDELAGEHGAILFRGFPLPTVDDFDRFIQAFGWENFAYQDSLSNAVRVNRTPRVFSANEAPPDVRIYLHHEMAQTPIYPSKLFFYCEQPADQGGATPLCRSDALFEQLAEHCPQFAADCEREGLKYTNVMPPDNDPQSGMGRSWRSTFRADTREEVEQRMTRLGYSWEWLEDGCLRATTPRLPAVRTLESGRKVFFNQLIAAFQGWKDTRNDPAKAIVLGDGSPLDTQAVATAIELAERLTFDLQWQQGDVALVDNYLVMHGRRSFVGTRKVLASLVAA